MAGPVAAGPMVVGPVVAGPMVVGPAVVVDGGSARATVRRTMAAKASGWVRWAPWPAPAISMSSAPGVCSASHATDSRCRGTDFSPLAHTVGMVMAVTSKGASADTDGIELCRQCSSVGPPFRLLVFGESVPRRITHHPSKEAFGGLAVALGGIGRGLSLTTSRRWRPGRPQGQPRHGRFVHGDAADGSAVPVTQRGPEGHRTAVAVSDHHGRPAVDDLEQVVDVSVQCGVDGERMPRSVVAPAVVDHGVQVIETAQNPGETGRPIERPVDEDDDRKGVGWPFGEVFGDR